MKSVRPVPTAATLLLAISLGCSAIVDPRDRDVPCELTPGGPDPCAALGTMCFAADGIHGFCRRGTDRLDSGPMPDTGPMPDVGPTPDGGCVPADGAMELCNGEDDDCDGVVDNGHDGDGDGVTWCGGGNPAYADCDDGSPEAHPAYPPGGVLAAAETCDGLDNDCNGMVDDGATICPGGQVCSAGLCYAPSDCRLPGNACTGLEFCNLTLTPATCEMGGCTPGSCTSPEVCNLESGDCVMPMALGSNCGTDAECASQLCAPIAAVGLPMGVPMSRICTSSCCRDDQCGAGQICWATGNGPKLCVPEGLLDAMRGTGAARASCSTGSECMSGLCFTSGGGCLGNCASNSDCGSGQRCAEATFDRGSQSAFTQLLCRADDSGSGGAGALCFSERACRYTWCWVGQAFCGGPCRSHADCGTDGAFCGITGIMSSGRIDRYRECRPKPHSGRATTGQNCTRPDDCWDYLCADGQCADACCADADCGGGRRCRMRDMGGGTYGTFCLPPAAG